MFSPGSHKKKRHFVAEIHGSGSTSGMRWATPTPSRSERNGGLAHRVEQQRGRRGAHRRAARLHESHGTGAGGTRPSPHQRHGWAGGRAGGPARATPRWRRQSSSCGSPPSGTQPFYVFLNDTVGGGGCIGLVLVNCPPRKLSKSFRFFVFLQKKLFRAFFACTRVYF